VVEEGSVVAGFVSWLRAERDRAAGVGFLVAGAISLAVGYAGVADAAYVPQALSFIASGGFFGLLLVAVGATLLITAALHDEWRKLDRIEAALRGDTLPDPDAVLAARQATPAPAAVPHGVPVPAGASAAGLALDWKAARLRSPLGLATAGLALAVTVAAAGFQRSANSGTTDGAFGGLATGVAGVALAALVLGIYTLILRRRIGGRKVALLAGWLTPTVADTPRPGVVLVGDGLTRFHLPGCPTLSSARTTPVRRGEVGDRTACAICGAR
jgi:hypothetical protein